MYREKKGEKFGIEMFRSFQKISNCKIILKRKEN